MSASDSSSYFLELGENSLLLARANINQRPRVVEAVREVWLGDAAAVDAALAEVKAAGSAAKTVVLLRLKSRSSLMSDAALAQKVKTPTAVADYLKEKLGEEGVDASWSWAAARDGKVPDGSSSWIIESVPQASVNDALEKIKGWSFEIQRCEAASLGLVGAISLAVKSAQSGVPVLVSDISETRTHIYLINAQGVAAMAVAPVGFDTLAEATQGALGLKFKGSAARLLFNDSYDFSEAAGKIVEPLVNGIRTAMSGLGQTPNSILAMGLLARQDWILQALAAGLGLKPFQVDIAAWNSANAVALAPDLKPEAISGSWLGLLGSAAVYDVRNPSAASPWRSVMTGTPVVSAPFVSALAPEPAPAPKPAVVITPPAKAAEVPKPAEPAKPVGTPPAAAKPAVVITPPARPAEPAKPVVLPPAKAVAPVAPQKAAVPEVKPVIGKPVENKPTLPAQVVKPQTPPAAPNKGPVKGPEVSKPAPAPAPASKLAPAPGQAKTPTPMPFQPQKKKSMMPIIIGLLVLALGGGGYYLHSANQKAEDDKRIEKERTERLVKEADDRSKKVEQQLRAEQEASRKAAEEARIKEIADREARARAEDEARRATSERMLNARGSLVIATDPVGATVAVGELAPRSSPTTLKDLRLGRYSLTITMVGYDTESRDIEIKENEVTDLGTIKLIRQVGRIEVTSTPAGLDFEIKPAGVLFVNAADVRTGQTPATISDLPVASYTVSISRASWPIHTSTVSVERDRAAPVTAVFSGGTVTINSTPSGAIVLRDNQNQIGTTPLTLSDVVPGNVSYTVTQRGMDPVTLTGKVEPGKNLTLSAALLDTDRVMKQGELDERPVQLTVENPELSAALQAEGGEVLITLVVGKDGVPTDIKISKSTNAALAKACLTAAAKWRFQPGKIKGKPVRTTVTIPFKIAPTQAN